MVPRCRLSNYCKLIRDKSLNKKKKFLKKLSVLKVKIIKRRKGERERERGERNDFIYLIK